MSQYPSIIKAFLEIEYDNGGIHRYRPEDEARREIDALIARVEATGKFDLASIDGWLGALSDDDLSTVCCGEESDMAALCEKAPAGTNDLLNFPVEDTAVEP